MAQAGGHDAPAPASAPLLQEHRGHQLLLHHHHHSHQHHGHNSHDQDLPADSPGSDFPPGFTATLFSVCTQAMSHNNFVPFYYLHDKQRETALIQHRTNPFPGAPMRKMPTCKRYLFTLPDLSCPASRRLHHQQLVSYNAALSLTLSHTPSPSISSSYVAASKYLF